MPFSFSHIKQVLLWILYRKEENMIWVIIIAFDIGIILYGVHETKKAKEAYKREKENLHREYNNMKYEIKKFFKRS